MKILIENPGRDIDYRAPSWRKYSKIWNDRFFNGYFPESSLFDICFTNNGLGFTIIRLNGKYLSYLNDSDKITKVIIDNVDRRLKRGLYSNLSGDIDTFLTLKTGINIIDIENGYNIKINFRLMYF